MTNDILRHLSYAVVCAGSPADAIRQMESYRGTIDLLITDIVMPEMNGRELADRICQRYPHIKRLIVTGYPADLAAGRGVLDAESLFLQKPFSLHELAAKVREALTAGNHGA